MSKSSKEEIEQVYKKASFKRGSVGHPIQASGIESIVDGESRLFNTSEAVEVGAVRLAREKICSPRQPDLRLKYNELHQSLMEQSTSK